MSKEIPISNTNLQKIVVLGPESTGKSTLSEALAKHYGVVDCKEYARQYLHENGTKYNFEDLLTIAKGQLTLEEEAIQKAEQQLIDRSKNKIVIDTNMYVMKVWCEYVFNNCHTYILDEIHKREYDLYLLCDIDLVWTPDEMREYLKAEISSQLQPYKSSDKHPDIGKLNAVIHQALESTFFVFEGEI